MIVCLMLWERSSCSGYFCIISSRQNESPPPQYTHSPWFRRLIERFSSASFFSMSIPSKKL